MMVPSSCVMATTSAASRSSIPKGLPKARSPITSKARALNQSKSSMLVEIGAYELSQDAPPGASDRDSHCVALHLAACIGLLGVLAKLVPLGQQDSHSTCNVRLRTCTSLSELHRDATSDSGRHAPRTPGRSSVRRCATQSCACACAVRDRAC